MPGGTWETGQADLGELRTTQSSTVRPSTQTQNKKVGTHSHPGALFQTHSLSQHAPALGLDFHPLPQGVGIVPIYTDLAVHVKLNVVAGRKLLDFLITSRLLPPELVAREGQDS